MKLKGSKRNWIELEKIYGIERNLKIGVIQVKTKNENFEEKRFNNIMNSKFYIRDIIFIITRLIEVNSYP
jgi:hypothetical protein